MVAIIAAIIIKTPDWSPCLSHRISQSQDWPGWARLLHSMALVFKASWLITPPRSRGVRRKPQKEWWTGSSGVSRKKEWLAVSNAADGSVKMDEGDLGERRARRTPWRGFRKDWGERNGEQGQQCFWGVVLQRWVFLNGVISWQGKSGFILWNGRNHNTVDCRWK